MASARSEQRETITVLVGIDGFRADYLERGVTPTLSRLAASGVSAPMRPSFPSKTFPNHWSIVTGLRPDRHGITANRIEDPARPGVVFTMADDDPFWWNAAAPIWVDAEKAGIRTATMFWPGSNVAIGGTRAKEWPNAITGGTRPSDWAQFTMMINNEQRVNTVLDWVRRPANIRPKLITLYFDTVDTAGHNFGPADTRTTDALIEVDQRIEALVKGFAEMNQPVNLIVVADHGMAETSSERTILIGDHLPADSARIIESGPYASFEPLPGKEQIVERALLGDKPHFSCWRKSEIPARLHYGKNLRVPPILCLAETGWQMLERRPAPGRVGGNHGWDPAAPEMAALFVGHGPAFKAAKLPSFDNVNVYALMRDLIGLPAVAEIDGDAIVFRDAITRP